MHWSELLIRISCLLPYLTESFFQYFDLRFIVLLFIISELSNEQLRILYQLSNSTWNVDWVGHNFDGEFTITNIETDLHRNTV